MSDIAIRCEGLSKRYRIGERESYKALRDVISDAAASPFRRLRSTLSRNMASSNGSHSASGDSSLITHHSALGSDSRFWALNDVSFDVKRSEVIGIIGRNGAGKSTLLKILSRITKPTKGRAQIHGRVASLLEVGTGFHPELTGRENIYLNAAILGMRRAEVKTKFDEIVAFAEIERFIDTPVKRYSSGMYVRLAFAVAAHLEPEILIVDEVLAVGDAQFQKKCLGKMENVGKEGRTVLFVSHNLAAVRGLCQKSILLHDGSVVTQGKTESVLNRYLSENYTESPFWKRAEIAPPDSDLFFEEITISNSNDTVTGNLDRRETFKINICLTVQRDIDHSQTAVRLVNQEGVPIFTTADTDVQETYVQLTRGRYRYVVEVPGGLLRPGSYSLVVASMVPGIKLYDVVQDKIKFSIEDTGNYASTLRDGRLGLVNLQLQWKRSENGNLFKKSI